MKLTSKLRIERDKEHPFAFVVYLDEKKLDTIITLLELLGMKDDTKDRKN